MDFNDKLNSFIALIPINKERCKTEEATKHSMVLPFINMLGYDVFNPLEVIPEFTADIGIKKGEKIDYAIIKNNQPIIFIECKHHEDKLDVHHSQLFRYFSVTSAKFAILTNGTKYQFFTDLEEMNKMDLKPFFEIDLLNLRPNQIDELRKFEKEVFDPELISSNASQLKYITMFKNLLEQDLQNPSDEFVKYFVKNLYSDRITQGVLEKFKGIIKNGVNQYINEVVQNKLKNALKSNDELAVESAEESIPEEVSKIVTTEEELQGFYIIRSMVGENIDLYRVGHRDNQTYFSILIDDKNYKWLCRLYFNSSQKYIILPDADKKELKFMISDLNEIYNLKSEILNALKRLN